MTTRRKQTGLTLLVVVLAVLAPTDVTLVQAAGARSATVAADGFVVASHPSANYGRSPSLVVDRQPATITFLRFQAGARGGRPAHATLELFARGSGPVAVRKVRGESWSESTLTYLNAPRLGRTVAQSEAVSGKWLELDVTALVERDGSFSVAVVGRSSQRIRFSSRESGRPAQLKFATGAGVNENAGWIVPCDFSHALQDDPIVYPGRPGASHLHDFIGGEVDAFSTYEQVVAGATTCSESSGDTGGYWTPALYLNAKKVDPAGSFGGRQTEQIVYYRGNNLDRGTVVRTIPRNLRIIAGNSKARSTSENPQLGTNLYYGCSDNSTDKLLAPPVCSTGIISVHIGFPNCWDGIHLDAPDHQSHMSYPDDGRCPRSHPVALPRVIMRLEYPVGTTPGAITLASGPPHTLHGDFWNTWRQGRLDQFVADCLNAGVDCKEV